MLKPPARLTWTTCLLAAALWVFSTAGLAKAGESSSEAFAANRLLGKGMNLGNALEAPNEGEWGVTLEAGYFDRIRQAGFDSVRIPIRWSAHAGARAPYGIDNTFFARVDWAIEQAQSRGMSVVINMHHYEELMTHPDDHSERFVGIWQQVAEHYRDYPQNVYFELLNEPTDELDAERWNKLLVEALNVVRQSNPRRMVIIGPVKWNSISALPARRLPEDDHRLIATVHYYDPHEFTHQNNTWDPSSRASAGMRWTGSPEEKQTLARNFDQAQTWSRQHQRPIYLGEFGTYEQVDMESRTLWTASVREAAQSRDFSWAYWEFCSVFGAFDRDANQWRRPLLDALLPEDAQ